MNPTLAQLWERKSVRVFLDRPVDDATRNEIIDAAIQAPSAGNQNLYAIIDVRDQAVKDELAELCDHQPFIATAPVLWVFLADCRRWLGAYQEAGLKPRAPGPGDLLIAYADALVAAQNAVVAAHSLGLGSCYIGDILENRERVAALLNLDDYNVPAAMLVMGWPTEHQLKRPKPPRPARGDLVSVDRYRRRQGRELRASIVARESGAAASFDYDGWMRAFCERKYESDFAREMNRSAAAYLRPFME